VKQEESRHEIHLPSELAGPEPSASPKTILAGPAEPVHSGRDRRLRDLCGLRPGRLRILLLRVGLLLALLAFWQWLGSSAGGQGDVVANPWLVVEWIASWATGGKPGIGWADLGATIEEALLGFILGNVIGIILAVISYANRWIALFSAPFVSVLNAIPKIGLAPLFIVIFGDTVKSKAYFVTAGICFISYFNVFNGLRTIDPLLLRNVSALGADRWDRIREIYAPSIIGWLASSLRLSLAWSLGGAVIAEYLGATMGIGYIVASGQQVSDAAEVISGIVIIAIVAMVGDVLVSAVDRRMTRWRPT
jgi:NitT/TauT family transport system permease protein